MAFINLTPHEITLFKEDGSKLVLPPSTAPARVRMYDNPQGTFEGVVVKGSPIPAGLEHLPAPQEEGLEHLYIVSRIVKDAVPDRMDVVVPNDIVRDPKGNIIGCRSVAL